VWFLIKSLCSSLLVPCDAGHLLDKIMLCGAVFIWISRKSFFINNPISIFFQSSQSVCLGESYYGHEKLTILWLHKSLLQIASPPSPHAQYVTLQHDYSYFSKSHP
jgi:hypothetical protein